MKPWQIIVAILFTGAVATTVSVLYVSKAHPPTARELADAVDPACGMVQQLCDVQGLVGKRRAICMAAKTIYVAQGNTLTPEQCERTANEIFEHIESGGAARDIQ